ncbi:MAG: hypothetical protein JW882_14840, partial [Deltaproteobacteria bacterium]|nr:hypothetical protein [Deltaproteobacteria bacterium]
FYPLDLSSATRFFFFLMVNRGQYFRPDEIKKGTGIISNSSFERHFQDEFEYELKIHEKRNEIRKKNKGDKQVINFRPEKNKAILG